MGSKGRACKDNGCDAYFLSSFGLIGCEQRCSMTDPGVFLHDGDGDGSNYDDFYISTLF